MAKFARPGAVALRHPETETYIVPQPGVSYADKDPLVKAYPWAFCSAAELEELTNPDQGIVESVVVEAATKAPGEKRSTKRA